MFYILIKHRNKCIIITNWIIYHKFEGTIQFVLYCTELDPKQAWNVFSTKRQVVAFLFKV